MNNLFKLLLIAAICFCVGNVFSQDAKGSQKAKTTQTSNFLNHKVEKGETIYSISKKYNVKESQLLELNPELSKGLKLGSEIKIPKTEKKSSVIGENTSKDKTKNKESKPLEEKDSKKSTTEKVKELPEFHLVEQGQTLYTISKLYGISIEEINEKNPEVLENGLKAGKTISIRNKEKVITENVLQSTLKNDTIKLKENVVSAPKETISNDNNNSMPLKKYELSVTLLLPFYTEKNVYEEETEEGSEEEKPKKNTEEIFGKSYNALEYYSGFKFACDSLSKIGYKINLKVIDCPIDSQEVVNLTKTDKLKNSDIIFGPFHQNLSFVLASYCLKNKIWFVTPYTQQNKILLNNPYAIKASASATTQV
ncbi:MAG: LysM peptidoglycan-binding domain-containing protein, partial [Bacteroidota bacterium]